MKLYLQRWIPAFAGMTILLALALTANAQVYVNPDTTQQPGDIYLQNTNVYYAPFAPPGDSDTRLNLCNESDQLRDPNGIGDNYRTYYPIVYDTSIIAGTSLHKFDSLKDWAPYGRAIGQNTPWQRFFTAKRDAFGRPHDIIVGSNVAPVDTLLDSVIGGHLYFSYSYYGQGPVVISKNEDVDFRASGRIKLKSGFRAKGGCFVHAYTEPQWDTTVFADEFSNTAKYHNQWHIGKGWGDINEGAECSFDSNAYIDTDYQAEDGYALDIVMREPPGDTCSCVYSAYNAEDTDNCAGTRLLSDSLLGFAFSSAMPRSCPFPFTSTAGLLGPVTYPHAPYGKYEFRDKIPHTLHHTNNWGGSWDMEFDLNETDNATMGRVNPNWNHHFKYGPYNGIFRISGTDTMFICPTATWGRHTRPSGIIINNILYAVAPYSLDSNTLKSDTMVASNGTALMGGFPLSIINTTDSTSFYVENAPTHYADTVTWMVDSTGTKFKAAWDTSGGVARYFTKSYQPITLTLHGYTPLGADTEKTYSCYWDHTLNSGSDTGWIRLTDTMPSTDLRPYIEAYQYVISDLGTGHERYPVPTVQIDNDTGNPPYAGDIAKYDSSAYRYHTFTMEWLPHEIRYLIDSNVVYRFPDRLVPKSSQYYDWVSTEPRSPVILFPAQIDIDITDNDSLGTNDSIAYTDHGDTAYKSLAYFERKFFESHLTNPGFWPVNGQPAAHHMLDYVKIWDVPADVKIPPYPH